MLLDNCFRWRSHSFRLMELSVFACIKRTEETQSFYPSCSVGASAHLWLYRTEVNIDFPSAAQTETMNVLALRAFNPREKTRCLPFFFRSVPPQPHPKCHTKMYLTKFKDTFLIFLSVFYASSFIFRNKINFSRHRCYNPRIILGASPRCHVWVVYSLFNKKRIVSLFGLYL